MHYTDNFDNQFEAVVIGAGHAGCEAALALARLGHRTLMLTVSLDNIAFLACNPSIGGTAKGQLVKEIDALGGEMGVNTDKTTLQLRMLNRGKGAAVQSLRAQADKNRYHAVMKHTLENTPNLFLRQAEVKSLLWEDQQDGIASDTLNQDKPTAGNHPQNEPGLASPPQDQTTSDSQDPDKIGQNIAEKSTNFVYLTQDKCVHRPVRITGVLTEFGEKIEAKAVILCCGVYLDSEIIVGDLRKKSGPSGFLPANGLTQSLLDLGLEIRRFKTGTPARVDKKSIDFSKMSLQRGEDVASFSPLGNGGTGDKLPCFLTYTTPETKRIILENLDKAPLFSGKIKGVGPRYCPSIEDKIVRFPDKERHQIFIEPEGEGTDEAYVQGMSSSMPAAVQLAMYRSVEGLENVRILRYAYAIEYDCINALDLTPALMVKWAEGLFSAGQINGSSGYEEAAAQGLMAGINAARLLEGKEPVVLSRSQAYIGVLIDDLVTKGTDEPYRMMTSRAEYRLSLRQDNADRLTPLGRELGLVDDRRWQYFLEKQEKIRQLKEILQQTCPQARCQALFERKGEAVSGGMKYADMLRRSAICIDDLLSEFSLGDFPREVRDFVETEIKYEGYLKKQDLLIQKLKKAESVPLSPDLDYASIEGLRLEARQKLDRIKPRTLAQAMGISGVSPADAAVLMLHVKQSKSCDPAAGKEEDRTPPQA